MLTSVELQQLEQKIAGANLPFDLSVDQYLFLKKTLCADKYDSRIWTQDPVLFNGRILCTNGHRLTLIHKDDVNITAARGPFLPENLPQIDRLFPKIQDDLDFGNLRMPLKFFENLQKVMAKLDRPKNKDVGFTFTATKYKSLDNMFIEVSGGTSGIKLSALCARVVV